MQPDNFNRWACVGYVEFSPKEGLPHMDWTANEAGISKGKIAWISMRGTKGQESFSMDEEINFKCRFFNFSDAMNTGISGEQYIYSATLEEMKEVIQKKWDEVVAFIKSLHTA